MESGPRRASTLSNGSLPAAHPPAPRRSHYWIWLVILILVGAAAGRRLFQLRRSQADPPQSAGAQGKGMPVAVAATAARLGDMPVYLDGLGSATPYYTVTVHTRVDGQLMNVYFREGQFVQAGDLLVEIDPRPFQVQLEQAEGQLARDQALLADARLDLERYRTLAPEDAIPKQQLDAQVATVGQYEGAIKTDQASIDNAKLQLVYCKITAPISGRIGLRLVDPGNIVHASDTNGLLVITQMQPITVVFTLPEDNLPPVLKKLRAGAAMSVDAYNRDRSQKLASGRLLTADNEIDPNTGTLKLKAVFENHANTLFPSQFVNVRLLLEVEHKQVIVPSVAIQRGSQGTFVFVVKPDHVVELRPVKTGITEGSDTSIDKGVQAGELVVTDGADKLQPGSRVTVRPESGMSSPVGPADPAAAARGGTRP